MRRRVALTPSDPRGMGRQASGERRYRRADRRRFGAAPLFVVAFRAPAFLAAPFLIAGFFLAG